jgi:hypothetical protein
MRIGLFIFVILMLMMNILTVSSYAQTVVFSKDNPYKGERVRITGKGWQPYEKIIFEIIERGPAYSGMVLTSCGETFAYDDGSFGGSCLIPPDLGYYIVDFYVNGLLAGQIRAR